MSKKTRGPRRRRRILLGLAGLMVLIAALVLLAPVLVNLGVGHGAIAGAVEKHVDGTVSFASLRTGWLGPQRVRGLRIVDRDGEVAADVDVTTDAGLLDLLRGLGSLQVVVSGNLKGRVDQSGSISLLRLIRSDQAGDAGDGDEDQQEPPPDEPPSLPAFGPIELVLDDVDLELHDEISARDLTITGLDGGLRYAPGGALTLNLAGATASGPLSGRLEIDVEATGLFDGNGRLVARGAAVKARATAVRLPVLFTTLSSDVERLELTASADDLGRAVTLALDAETSIEGAEPSRVQGEVTLERPVDDRGAFAFALERLTGSLRGERVPTGLLQPVLVKYEIRTDRDLGPLADLEASFSSGSVRDFAVKARAEKLRAELAGTIDVESEALTLGPSTIDATIDPALVAAHAAGYEIDAPLTVALAVEAARGPLSLNDAARLLETALDATVRVKQAVTLRERGAQGRRLGTVSGLECALSTARLGDGVNVTAEAGLDGATVRVMQTLSGLLDEKAEFDLARVRPAGELTVEGLTSAHVLPFLSGTTRDLLAAAWTAPLTLSLATGDRDGALHAELVAHGGDAAGAPHVALSAVERPEGLDVTAASLRTGRLPALLEALQVDREGPLVATAASEAALHVEPFLLPGNRSDGWTAPAAPLMARLEAERVQLAGVPMAVEPVNVSGLLATLATRPGALAPGELSTRAAIARAGAEDGALGDLELDLSWGDERELTEPAGRLFVKDARLEPWEALLGREESLAYWVGSKGTFRVEWAFGPDGLEAEVIPGLTRFKGRYRATLGDDMVTLSTDNGFINPHRKALQAKLPEAVVTMVRDDQGRVQKRRVAPLTVTDDVPVSLVIRTLRVPRALLEGEPFDPEKIEIDVEATAPSLAFAFPDGAATSVDDLRLLIGSGAARRGVSFALTGTGREAGAGEAGPAGAGSGGAETIPLRLEGRLVDLFDPEAGVNFKGSTLELDADVRSLPTALVDGLADWNGLLVAALGGRIGADFEAREFSRTGGTLSASVVSPNGWMKGTVHGADQGLRARGEDELVTAELRLTSALGSRLLSSIHPIFPDVRSAREPIRVRVGELFVPLDGDVSRLDADVEITVGAVELDSGSLLLGALTLFDQAGKPTVQGDIEPIRLSIRQGVVSYETFNVRIDKYTMRWTGRADLNTRRLDLRTELPLGGLAGTFREVRGYAEGLVVPLVVRGTFEAHKLELDPEFDLAGELIKAGLGAEINKALGDEGDPLGGILGEIFKKKDEKKKDKDRE